MHAHTRHAQTETTRQSIALSRRTAANGTHTAITFIRLIAPHMARGVYSASSPRDVCAKAHHTLRSVLPARAVATQPPAHPNTAPCAAAPWQHHVRMLHAT
mmetsp:Transcript_51812/g.143479  ORF Transcript_51812/g.143479 Transcript_51812/m.143479 type:complete len:101 (-) Transcript_51812:251-553(-)|eukprot:383884-Prymnesium_polylepis.2